MSKTTWAKVMVPINGPEDLREITRGSDVEIVQLKPGRLRGCITHFGIGNTGISVGRFNSAIRMRGTLHREKAVLGTVLDSASPVTQWWKEVRPGDVGVFPAGVEFDAIHCGSSSYLVVSTTLQDLSRMFGSEERLADPAFWSAKHLYHTDRLLTDQMLQRLMRIMSDVERKFTAPPSRGSRFSSAFDHRSLRGEPDERPAA